LAALVAAAAWLVGSRRTREDLRAAPTALAREMPPGASRAPADADELARSGRYGEAVHALLVAALARLAARQAHHLPPSLTAREAARVLMLPQAPSAALEVLLLAVESDRWIGRPAGAADWERCRTAGRALLAEGSTP
jgi:hypothetical protein